MRVALAYLAMIAIWATVPLAVKWSLEAAGWPFAALARFGIAAVALCVLLALRRQPVPLDAKALRAYAASGVNMLAFIVSFWGIQHIPSGWMGVMWGMSPLITAALSVLWLGEPAPGWLRGAGLALGVAGLAVIFATAFDAGLLPVLGLAVMLVTVTVNAWMTLWIKRSGTHLPVVAVTALGVVLALPAYALVWYATGAALPVAPPARAVAAIVHLGVLATAVVYVLFYYVLRHLEATRIALIGMLSPVLSLFLGMALNGEPFSPRILAGAALIVGALVLHEYLPRRLAGARAD